MRNILIMGLGRSGKTTLSNMLKAKYPQYNLIHSDSIKWAIIRADGKEKYYRENIKEQCKWELSLYYQNILIEFFNSSIRNDDGRWVELNGEIVKDNNIKSGKGYLLETGQLEVNNVVSKIDLTNTIVICLGLGNSTKEEIFELCRKYDTEEDWSYSLSDEELTKFSEMWYKQNETLKRSCSEHGIKYYDTSKSRKETLNKIIEQIRLELEM